MSVLHSTHRAQDERLLHRDVRPERIRLKLAPRINVTTISIFAGNFLSTTTMVRLFFSFQYKIAEMTCYIINFPLQLYLVSKKRVNQVWLGRKFGTRPAEKTCGPVMPVFCGLVLRRIRSETFV